MSRRSRIAVNIERIVIDRALLAGEHPRDVEAAVKHELERLLAATHAPDLVGAGHIDACAQPLPAARSGISLGERIASAVHSSLATPRSA